MAIVREQPSESGRLAARRGPAQGVLHPTYALRPLLRRLRRIDRPRVLDLGAAEGPNLEFFIQRGCRVRVENLLEALPLSDTSPPIVRVRRATPRVVPDLLAGRHPAEEAFDLALAWDLLDLVETDVAAGLVREMRSRLRAGGMVWALFDTSPRTAPPLPRRFRIVNEHSLEHRLLDGRAAARFIHANRDILRMFDGFEVLSSTHLRVGLREMLLGRAAASAA
jgi:hypothetical protein